MEKNQFNKGAELNKQIYKEGEPTWGCKSGVLDFEDVKDFLKIIKKYIEEDFVYYGDDEMEQDESREDLIFFIESKLGEKI
jgi:hypothetical protein